MATGPEAGAAETPGRDQPRDTKVLGVPYDLRRPTVARTKSRLYNRDEPRLFPPKVFGAGWTINFYWLVRPFRYLRNRRSSGPASRS